MKICSSCKIEKSLAEFSRNRARKDGLQGICKTCSKRICKEYYQTSEGKIAQSKAGKKYTQTAKGKISQRKRAKKQHEKFPERLKAINTVNNAIRNGRLKRSIYCEECGLLTKTEGHHPDYNKPLKVNWLCKTCHTNIHNKNEKGG